MSGDFNLKGRWPEIHLGYSHQKQSKKNAIVGFVWIISLPMSEAFAESCFGIELA